MPLIFIYFRPRSHNYDASVLFLIALPSEMRSIIPLVRVFITFYYISTVRIKIYIYTVHEDFLRLKRVSWVY